MMAYGCSNYFLPVSSLSFCFFPPLFVVVGFLFSVADHRRDPHIHLRQGEQVSLSHPTTPTPRILMSSLSSPSPVTDVRVYSDSAALASALASVVQQSASAAIAERDTFHVGISGGSLPSILGKGLLSLSSSLDLSHWHWWFVDERCVRKSDSDSNYAEAKRTIFEPLGVKEENIHAIDEEKVQKPVEVREGKTEEMGRWGVWGFTQSVISSSVPPMLLRHTRSHRTLLTFPLCLPSLPFLSSGRFFLRVSYSCLPPFR